MNSLVAPYKNSVVGSSESVWLLLQQEETEDDTATIDDAAELLDTLYDIDGCEDVPTEDESTAEEDEEITTLDEAEAENSPVDEDEFWRVAGDLLGINLCSENGCDTVYLRVYRSDTSVPYKLVLDNGEQGETTVETETKKESISVGGESSITFSAPVKNGTLKYNWVSCRGAAGKTVSGVSITPDGTSGRLSASVTGIVRVQYESEFDRVAVSIPRTESNEAGECLVLGLYAGLTEECELQAPEVDESAGAVAEARLCHAEDGSTTFNWSGKDYSCYENVHHQIKCSCSGSPAPKKSYDTEEDCDCPEAWGEHISAGRHLVGSRDVLEGYVQCEGEGQASRADIAEYKQRCCVEGMPPPCKDVYAVYKGGKTPDINELRARYGGEITLIPVGPKDGPCGTWHTEYLLKGLDCCDVIQELEWDDENSAEVIADDSSGMIFFTGGGETVNVSVRGEGFFLNAGHTIKDGEFANGGGGAGIVIYTSHYACGTCLVTIRDDCSIVEGYVRCTEGKWQLVDTYLCTDPAVAHLGKTQKDGEITGDGDFVYEEELGGVKWSFHCEFDFNLSYPAYFGGNGCTGIDVYGVAEAFWYPVDHPDYPYGPCGCTVGEGANHCISAVVEYYKDQPTGTQGIRTAIMRNGATFTKYEWVC